MIALKGSSGHAIINVELEKNPIPNRGTPAEELKLVALLGLERQVSINTKLGAMDREELIKFLRADADVFAWWHKDMPDIDLETMVHRLNLDPSLQLIKQKCRPINSERSVIIVEKVKKLLKAQCIKEVHYYEWLSNVVLVKKHQTKSEECVSTL